MRFNPSVTWVLGSLVLVTLTGCPAPDQGPRLHARLVEPATGTASVQGVYFGELEMLAYDYRPGQTLQAGQSFGFNGTQDWSYWGALLNGYDETRDLVLKPGQWIDSEDVSVDNGATGPRKDFIQKEGVFDIDLFEVVFHRTGVIHNDVYYGMNADFNGLQKHPLHKYPQWATIEDRYCTPAFPGQPEGQDLNVFFVRSDWFPRHVIVNTKGGASPARYAIDRSSLPLTPDQESLILSLVNNGTQRRGYENLLFIPMPGPVLVQLDSGTSGGTGPLRYEAEKFRIKVNFDLSDLLHPSTDWSVPRVQYKGDANDVPFKLAISFEPR